MAFIDVNYGIDPTANEYSLERGTVIDPVNTSAFGIVTSKDKQQNDFANRLNDYNFSAREARKVRDFNSAEAALDRNFQARQAAINRDFNSAEAQKAYDRSVDYSRQVSELKRAGLNPAMIYGSGTTEVGSSTAASAGALAAGSRASASAASAGASSSNSGTSLQAITSLVSSAVQVASLVLKYGK